MFNSAVRVIAAVLALLALSGCGSVVGRLQRVEPKRLETIYVSNAGFDFWRAFEAGRDNRDITSGPVTVHAPACVATLAEALAERTSRCYDRVERTIGLRWRFKSELYLVPAFRRPQDWRFAKRKKDTVTVGLFVLPGEKTVGDVAADNLFFPTAWAHEITEGTMVLAGDNGPVFLMDPYIGPLGITFGTRWFREGLSNYAALVALRELAGPQAAPKGSLARPFSSLALVGPELLRWSQGHRLGGMRDCGPVELYGAALGVLLELTERNGSDAVKRLMARFGPKDIVRGRDIQKALREELDFDMPAFLEEYKHPFIGVMLGPQWPRKDVLAVREVLDDSPASAAGLKVGDLVLSVAGEPARNVWQLEWALRKAGVGAKVALGITRKSKPLRLEITLGEFSRQCMKKDGKKPKARAEPIGVMAMVRPIY